MADDNRHQPVANDIVKQLGWFIWNEARIPAGLTLTVIGEIERLRAIIVRFVAAKRAFDCSMKFDQDYYAIKDEYYASLAALEKEVQHGHK